MENDPAQIHSQFYKKKAKFIKILRCASYFSTLFSVFNPLSHSIQTQILQTYLNTFSGGVSSEKLFEDQNTFPYTLILISFSIDYVLMLFWENRCWSLLRLSVSCLIYYIKF